MSTDNWNAGVWLLWVGIGSGASLSSLGYSWMISQATSFLFFAVYGYFNLDASKVLRSIFFTVLSIFFRDFDVAGSIRVPSEGPLILACAPHANQFVDGLVVLRAVSHREDVGMLTAAATMRRQFVGAVARLMGCVGVERPQDVAVIGTGNIVIQGTRVTGQGGTRFLEQIKERDSLVVTSGPFTKMSARVARVDNNSELELMQPIPIEDTGDSTTGTTCSFKIVPYIDQSEVFASVEKHLSSGKVIMIFPEGGSHDRTKLLPLKHGVAQMALQTYASKGIKVPIVPVGINYFKGHRFRSRVFIEIGNPIIPTAEMVQKFAEGGQSKREAVGDLMSNLLDSIQGVTVQSDDFESLQFCRFMRRVYPSTRAKQLDPAARFQLVHAFTEGYEKDKNDDRVVRLKSKCLEYMRLLKTYNISDHRVATIGSDSSGSPVFTRNASISTLVYSSLQLLIFSICALPGLILTTPIVILTRHVSSREARKALRKSSVKVAGRDVIATWKLMVSFVLTPILHITYTILLASILTTEAVATIYFFFGPVLVAITVLAWERGELLVQSARLSWLALGDPGVGQELVKTRKDLQHQVRKLATELKWDSAIGDHEETKHLYRRFSKSLNRQSSAQSLQSAVSMEDESWDLDDAFFQNPRNRGLSEYSQ